MAFRFDEFEAEPVSQEEVDRVYADLHARLDVCPDVEGAIAVVESWDEFRRKLDTWGALVHVRFTQDTTNESHRKARDEFDERAPKLTEAAIEFQRKLLASSHRPALERELGEYVFQLWECSILTYDPAIEAETIEESKLSSRYDEILGSAEIDFRGETYNLSGLGKFFEHPDRETRHEAEQARWGWFAEKGDELDEVFDKLVKLRHAKAKKLGFESYTQLAYKGLSRTDYDDNDVARYRDAVRTHVVPIGAKIRTAQAKQLGVDPLMFWDEAVADPQGNPAPHAEHDALVEAGQKMFDEIGHGLDDFFRMMIDSRLTDLGARKGKAVGGYCTDIATERVPFIYANFNGTKGDVEVFTHEMGHAFQCYQARDAFPMDLWWPTAEAAEIHSMSLEFLTWPQMEHFFDGDGAQRFRRIHLTESLLFLPYGVAVDHFQHLVYADPEASPQDRHEMWKKVERLYLPWRNYGDLDRPAQGAFWQRQPHIYRHPFYYIDYTLALACALQFWVKAEGDREGALRAYTELCSRGGRDPFQSLAKSAGLRSPFESGCLEKVVEQSASYLGF